jgi:hypothetical protein
VTPVLTLELLGDELAVCRLPVDAAVPNWAWGGDLTSITATDDELSIVCTDLGIPDGVTHTSGWRGLRVRGTLDFSLVGILSGLASTLAEAGISVFAISTHDTDYILVRSERLDEAIAALEAADYEIA